MALRASTDAAEYRLRLRSAAARLDKNICEDAPSGDICMAVQ